LKMFLRFKEQDGNKKIWMIDKTKKGRLCNPSF
jgi:hypothetical protein